MQLRKSISIEKNPYHILVIKLLNTINLQKKILWLMETNLVVLETTYYKKN